CRSLNLFAHAMVAIDGSRFKVVNSRDRSFSRGSIQRRMEQVEASIERYLSALETADRQEGEVAEAKSARLKDKAWIATVLPYLCDGGILGTYIDWRGLPTVHSAVVNLG